MKKDDWWFEERYGWDINSVREAIGWIDDQLIELITERIKLGWVVAKVKRKNNSPIFDPAQEKRVISRWVLKAKAEGVSQEKTDFIVTIIKALMEASKTMQKEFFQNHSKPAVR